MKFNKLSFALGNVIGAAVVGVAIVACGGGGSGGGAGFGSVATAPAADTGSVGSSGSAGAGGVPSSAPNVLKASNVLLRQVSAKTASAGKEGFIHVQASQLPDNVQVLASNVTLTTSSNELTSTDLQSALDREIAVDLSKAIVGIWNVQNLTSDPTYRGDFAMGKVEFKADGSYIIISGGFAAAGKVVAGTNSFCTVPTSTGYTLVDGAVYFTASSGGDSVTTVAKVTSDTITLIGDGGCGLQGQARISRLTRAAIQPAALKLQPKPVFETMKVAATS